MENKSLRKALYSKGVDLHLNNSSTSTEIRSLQANGLDMSLVMVSIEQEISVEKIEYYSKYLERYRLTCWKSTRLAPTTSTTASATKRNRTRSSSLVAAAAWCVSWGHVL